jgi:hypothetical protein
MRLDQRAHGFHLVFPGGRCQQCPDRFLPRQTPGRATRKRLPRQPHPVQENGDTPHLLAKGAGPQWRGGTLRPRPPQLQVEPQCAGIEGFAARRQSQAIDLPADEARTRIDMHTRGGSRIGAAVEDVLLRQPFERGARGAHFLGLRGAAAVAAIELGGGRRGDQRMRARVDLHVDAQLIATHHAAGRMHQVHVAGVTLGMERPLHHQRTLVPPLHQACAARLRCGPVC